MLHSSRALSQDRWSWRGSNKAVLNWSSALGLYTCADVQAWNTGWSQGVGAVGKAAFSGKVMLLGNWGMKASVQKQMSGWHMRHPLAFILFSWWHCQSFCFLWQGRLVPYSLLTLSEIDIFPCDMQFRGWGGVVGGGFLSDIPLFSSWTEWLGASEGLDSEWA